MFIYIFVMPFFYGAQNGSIWLESILLDNAKDIQVFSWEKDCTKIVGEYTSIGFKANKHYLKATGCLKYKNIYIYEISHKNILICIIKIC